MQDITLDGTRITFVYGTPEHLSGTAGGGELLGFEVHSQIRFSGGQRLDDVSVDRMLAPLVQGHSDGIWCVAKVGSRNAIVGFRDGTGRFHDADPRNFVPAVGAGRLMAWAMILVGIPLSVFVVGLGFVGFGAWSLVQLGRARRIADAAYDLAADPSVVPMPSAARPPLAAAA